jgi:hypothetical protein
MNYHREHLHGFAKIALPLHEVVRPKEPFVWHEEQQNATMASSFFLVVHYFRCAGVNTLLAKHIVFSSPFCI